MERFELQSNVRADAGKGVARKLRGEGRLPAVLYGRKEAPMGISLAEVDVRNILRKHPESAIVDLTVAGEGGGTLNAIIRDVQRHPASGKILHVDLQRIRLDEQIRVEVHIEVQGTPAGVKEQGGVLEHGTRTVNVMTLPTDIPDAILVDVSALRIHDSAKIRDVMANYPKIVFLDDPDTTLATVIPPIVEAVVAPTAEVTAEPELIRKPGAEEEGEEGAAAAPAKGAAPAKSA
ncbi:MAG TPA: 50S ribosomal protein L25, partial [Candidatus Krumholzibacteria bacterium]|nr:50S ribosomal protein L25 [Candidatus Krumholzibacteria bacterium]